VKTQEEDNLSDAETKGTHLQKIRAGARGTGPKKPMGQNLQSHGFLTAPGSNRTGPITPYQVPGRELRAARRSRATTRRLVPRTMAVPGQVRLSGTRLKTGHTQAVAQIIVLGAMARGQWPSDLQRSDEKTPPIAAENAITAIRVRSPSSFIGLEKEAGWRQIPIEFQCGSPQWCVTLVLPERAKGMCAMV